MWELFMNDESTDAPIDLYGDEIGRVQLIQHYGDDKMVVNSARVSHGAMRYRAGIRMRICSFMNPTLFGLNTK